jgi:hypothetical protein
VPEQTMQEQKTRLICSDGFMIYFLHINITSPASKNENDDVINSCTFFFKKYNAKL